MSRWAEKNVKRRFAPFLFQVTEQVKTSVESQVLGAQEQVRQLEKKLLEAEKENSDLKEEKQKAITAIEQQVWLTLCT